MRVTPNPFEGELHCDGSQGRLIQVRDDDGKMHAFGPGYGTVEVLEPVDDPRKDPVGTVREGGGHGSLTSWAKAEGQRWELIGGHAVETPSSALLGTAHPVVGAVPGTPAWDLWIRGDLPGAPKTDSCPLCNAPEQQPLTCPGCGSADPAVRRTASRGAYRMCVDAWHGEALS